MGTKTKRKAGGPSGEARPVWRHLCLTAELLKSETMDGSVVRQVLDLSTAAA